MDEIVRDNKGRFKKGHSGNPERKFKNRPANAGRKPSAFKTALATLKEHGEALSLEDFNRAAAHIVGLSNPDLKEFLKRDDVPIALRVVAQSINGDLQNKQMRNLELLLSRLYGAPKQTTDITTGGQPIRSRLESLSIEELMQVVNGVKGIAKDILIDADEEAQLEAETAEEGEGAEGEATTDKGGGEAAADE